jgi:hypothetical protein
MFAGQDIERGRYGDRLRTTMPELDAAADGHRILRAASIGFRSQKPDPHPHGPGIIPWGTPSVMTLSETFPSPGRYCFWFRHRSASNKDGDEKKKKDDNVEPWKSPQGAGMGKKMQFVHRAKRYELTREDFIRAVKNVSPARVQRYSVTIGKLEYPTRQVVALATGRPSIEFTSAAAYRILQKFGFDIDVWE